jgi:hypothetical protein
MGRNDPTGAATGHQAKPVIFEAYNSPVKSNILIAQAGAVALLLLCALPHRRSASGGQFDILAPQTFHRNPPEGEGNFKFCQVSPNLYRGPQPSITGIESLQKMGVNIVIDMRGGRNNSEKAAARKLGMQYVSILWHCPFPSDQPFCQVLEADSGK